LWSLVGCLALLGAAGTLALAALADGGPPVAPVPSITRTVRLVRIDGREQLLVTSIGVYN
jgi:hypothetical protein